MGAEIIIITRRDDVVMATVVLKYHEPSFMLFNSGAHNAGPSRRQGAGRTDFECTRVFNIIYCIIVTERVS